MKKFLLFVVILLVVLVAGAYAAKDIILQNGIQMGVGMMTGFPTKVGKLHLDIPTATLQIQDLQILNPPNFDTRLFVDIPEIFVSLNLSEILKKEKIHLYEIRLNIQQVNIEKTKAGVSNVELISAAGKPKEGAAKKEEAAPAPAEKKPAMPFQLDRLSLTLRRVSYNDNSSIVPQKMALDLGVENQTLENVNDPKAIVNFVLMKIFTGTSLGKLAGNLNLDLGKIQGDLTKAVGATGAQLLESAGQAGTLVKGAVGETAGLLNQATDATKNINLNKTGDVLKGTATNTKEALTQVTGNAKEELGNLFGKLKSKVSSTAENTSSGSSSTT